MKNNNVKIAMLVLVWWLVSMPAFAAPPGDSDFEDSYQLALLYQPTKEQLEAEQQGQVNIYVGLTDKQVNNALDNQFHRIDAMMFASVIRTDTTGNPMRHSITGELLVEEDGCD